MRMMIRTLARMLQTDRACAEHRYIRTETDFTEYDRECIDTLMNQLTRLFYTSDGRKWEDVLSDIKTISGVNSHIGFKAQATIINTCHKFGINFN